MVSLEDGGMIDDDDFDVDVFFKICFDKELVLGSASLLTGDDFCVSRRDYFGQLWRRRVPFISFSIAVAAFVIFNLIFVVIVVFTTVVIRCACVGGC